MNSIYALWCVYVKAASRADRVLFIKDGELNYQIKKYPGMSNTKMNEEIVFYLTNNEMIR